MLKMTSRIESVAAVVAVALLAVGCLAVLRPFVSAILWATVLTYTTWPMLLRLEHWMGGRRTYAALVMTTLIAVVMVLPFVVAGITLAENVSRLEELFKFMQGGFPVNPPKWVRELPWVGAATEQVWPQFVQNAGWVSEAMRAAGLNAGKWLLSHSLDFGKGILQLTLSVIIMFVFYRDGERVADRLARGAQRIAGDVSQRLIAVAGGTVRSVVYGIIGTALAQAIVAAIGFWMAGVPSPFLWGLVTFLMGLVPGGPPFVWVPAMLWVFGEGRVGWGVFLAVWGLLCISGIDNIIRPYLISRGSKLPFVVVLLGVIGGVMTFGFIGLFLGPVLLAVGYSLAREFTTISKRSGNRGAEEAPGDGDVNGEW